MRPAELPEVPGVLSAAEVAMTADSIAAAQESSGAVPWFPGGHVDPWDHVECAMALSATGRYEQAVAAYDWLRRTQRPDGSWPTKVAAGAVEDATADVNHCAYVAVGVWHHLLITGDDAFAARMWDTVRRAIDFVVGLQTARGEIPWAKNTAGEVADEALLAGCASMHQSLRCASALAEYRGRPQPDWELAADQLGHVVADHEEVFGDRRRYSMDWYYPILGGALRGPAADKRIAQRWEEFVVPGLGARCVADQPWVTGAETCELVMALEAIGDRDRAVELFAAVQRLRDEDGSYWTGYQFVERVRWPVERSTWTAAAVILAADALSGATPGAGIFRDAGGRSTPTPADPVACGCEPTACSPSVSRSTPHA